MPERSVKPVTEWKSMGSLNRERMGSPDHEPETEFRSMRKLGLLFKRKSSRGQAKQTQLTLGASNNSPNTKQAVSRKMSDVERIKRLESQLSAVHDAAQKNLDALELKAAHNEAERRSKAAAITAALESQLKEAENKSTALSARVEELETLASKYAQSQNVMAKEIKDRNEVLKIREDEISRVRHENRPRPFQGIIRTFVVGSTGFMFAIASAAASR